MFFTTFEIWLIFSIKPKSVFRTLKHKRWYKHMRYKTIKHFKCSTETYADVTLRKLLSTFEMTIGAALLN